MASRTFGERWQLVRAATLRPPDERQRAGDAREERLQGWLERHSSRATTSIVRGKRIPNGAGRSEIDFVVVTPQRIVVLETKNWMGELVVQEGRWVQRRTDGSAAHHHNVVQINQAKGEALVRALVQWGIDLDPAVVGHLVLLLNPRLRVAPAIAGHPHVLTAAHLEGFVDLEALVAHCPASGAGPPAAPLAPQTCQAVVAALEGWPAWDRLDLYGGAQWKGDLLALTLNGRRLALRDDRSGATLRTDWSRSLLGNIVRVLLRDRVGDIVSPNGRRRALTGDDTLT